MQLKNLHAATGRKVPRCESDASAAQHWPYGFLGNCRSGEYPPGPSKVNGRATNGRGNVGYLPVGHWRHGAIISVGGGHSGQMGMDVCMVCGSGENSISTCGCKDANARLDECCLWECGAVHVPSHVRKNAMPRRSKMWGYQRMPKCASTVWTAGARGAEKCNGHPPTIARRQGGCARGCTSLPCTSGTVRTLCPVEPSNGDP